jgi:hypothetical protein
LASTVFFNGRTTAIPGSYSEIDATGLAVVGLASSGIVACLGEAEGGSPYNGDIPVHRISNPGKVGKTFRQGDLREAGNILFDPSKDVDIPGGAQEVKFVKVNPATRSTVNLPNISGDVLQIDSVDYGLFTTQISITIEDGTSQGKAITIVLGDAEEVLDDVGGDPVFTTLYTPGANGADTMLITLDNTSGVDAQWTRTSPGLAADYDGTYQTLIAGLSTDFAASIVAGNVADVVSSSVADVGQTVTLIGIDFGTGLPTTEVLVLNGTTLVVGTTTWTKIIGVILSAAAVGTVTVRDNGTLTVLTTLAPSVLTKGVFSFGGDILEFGGGPATLVSSGASTNDVILLGSNLTPVAQAETITLTGVVPVVGLASWSQIQYVVVGEVPFAQSLTLSGLLWNKGEVAKVSSSAAGDTTQTVTIYGLSTLDAPQTETLALNGIIDVVGTATWNKILGVVLSAAAVGTVAVESGVAGGAKAFDLAPTVLYGGFLPVDNVAVSGTTVTWSDNGAEDRTALLVGLDALGAAQVVVITSDGTIQVPVETWSAITGIVLGHVAAAIVTVSGEAFNLLLTTYATISEVGAYVNGLSGWVLTISPNSGQLLIADLDNVTNANALVLVSFNGDLAQIAAAINNASQLVTATVLAGASGPPDNIGPVFLVGGTEGVTTFADWQAALDIIRDDFVSTVVVMTSDEAIHAAVVAHCTYMTGPGRKERDCVLGTVSGTTFTEAKAAAVALNTRHARLCIQDMVRFNTSGEREQFPPYFHACIAAGQQAGASVGTSLTFKFTNVLDVIGDDATYTLQDDGNELIQSGILVQDKIQGIGFRWLRNITTHLIDDNAAFVEAAVNQAVNFTAFNIRTNLEAVVGKKGFAGTVNAAAAIVIQTLGLLSDPQDPIVVDWRNLTIELEADVMTVSVQVAPVNSINFVLTTIHLVPASFAAAA